jgi:hypothetical protein
VRSREGQRRQLRRELGIGRTAVGPLDRLLKSRNRISGIDAAVSRRLRDSVDGKEVRALA